MLSGADIREKFIKPVGNDLRFSGPPIVPEPLGDVAVARRLWKSGREILRRLWRAVIVTATRQGENRRGDLKLGSVVIQISSERLKPSSGRVPGPLADMPTGLSSVACKIKSTAGPVAERCGEHLHHRRSVPQPRPLFSTEVDVVRDT